MKKYILLISWYNLIISDGKKKIRTLILEEETQWIFIGGKSKHKIIREAENQLALWMFFFFLSPSCLENSL